MAKFKILIVSANAVRGAHLKVDEEYNAIKNRLRGNKHCEVPTYNPSATWEAVIDDIKRYQPHIVHFSAHGSPSQEIVLNNEAGKPKSVPTKALEQLFRVMKGNVRLVVMNSCYSAIQAKAVAKFIECVFGVDSTIADDTAIKFSPPFYEALGEGKSISAAYDEAMISVYGDRPGKQNIPRFKGRGRPEEITFVQRLSARKTKPFPGLDISTGVEPVVMCESLHWDLKIDEEGDAYNEMVYGGIVLAPARPHLFKLPPAEVQSGHTTAFELIRDARTTEGASLKLGPIVTSTKIEVGVSFANRPTCLNPAKFAIRSWDWNVYSMNVEEYRQKPGWSEHGLDYAQKFVPEPWEVFSLRIQFPEQIVFATFPFFEIYDPGDGWDLARNDELTASHRHCFNYSTTLNLANLFVIKPPAPFAYRVSWRLGESQASALSALNPIQRQRQLKFARKLLLMRGTLETNHGDTAGMLKLKEDVDTVLTSVAEHVQNALEGVELDPASLEISLMVLDEDHKEKSPTNDREYPVLRVVAGTLLKEPAYRELALFVGDGNAGRAWKRRMARVFDLNDKDPKRHIYVDVRKQDRGPNPGSLPPGPLTHRFLVSIPLIDSKADSLIYGILNLGTFAEEQAEVLRKIGSSTEVEKLASFAQSYVLKRLMELIKL